MEIIYASAGSGKTHKLVQRYLEKVINNEKIENIYCLTFTKKATAEIKERILLFSKKLIDGDEEIKKSLNINKISKTSIKNLEQIPFKDLKIYTIDSFLFKILQFLNMDNKKIISDEEMFILLEQAKYKFSLKHIKDKEGFEDLVNLLKNIYLSKRSAIVKMLDEENKTNIIDLYSYKELNKTQLEERIKARLSAIEHPICQELSKKKDIINSFMQSKLVNQYKSLENNILYNLKKSDQVFLKQILLYVKAYLFIEKSNNTLKDLFQYFSLFETEIEELKKLKNGIDYNDILIELNNLLKDPENKMSFEYYIFNNIGHILVDEYQDTSSFQDKILNTIFTELRYGANNVTQQPTIFLVGDVKQSIYEWRDADSQLFLNKVNSIKKESYVVFDDTTKIEEKNFEVKGIENTNIHRIEKNNYTRRIHPKLVYQLNNLFKDSGLKGFEEHEAKRTDVDTPSLYEELFISDSELVENSIKLVEGLVASKKEYKDICILARNNDILNAIERKVKINELNGNFSFPTKKDNGGFTDSLEVELINDILLSIFSIKNSLYIKRFCEKVIENTDEIYSHFNNINYSDEIEYYINIINELKYKPLSIEDKLKEVIERFDLFSYMLKIRKIASINVMNRYVEYLLSIIPYIKNENEFVERILNIKNNKSLNLDINEEMNAVHLLTIHKAKGLEFDTVILVEKDIFKEMIYGLNILPNGNIFEFGKNKLERPIGYKEFDNKLKYYQLEEKQSQLRLAYVAYTRAKNNLIVLKTNK